MDANLHSFGKVPFRMLLQLKSLETKDLQVGNHELEGSSRLCTSPLRSSISSWPNRIGLKAHSHSSTLLVRHSHGSRIDIKTQDKDRFAAFGVEVERRKQFRANYIIGQHKSDMPPHQRSANKVRQPPSPNTLSDLPDNVIDNIAMRLPLKEAVRTSILSRKWRFIWARLPQLILNDDFFPLPASNRGKRKQKKIMTLPSIYEILVLHHAPVSKFVVNNIGESNFLEIDKVILFLSRHGIEDLTLGVNAYEKHKLPSYFFSCMQLKHLHLSCCALHPPPTFHGFSNLLSLHLVNVMFPSVLTSAAPQLERLTLVYSIYSVNGIVEIVAPNLCFLEVMGRFRFITLKNAPRLLNAHLETFSLKQSSNLEEFLRCAPNMENLVLEGGFRSSDYTRNDQLPEGSFDDRPGRPPALCHLKHLRLKLFWFNRVIAFSCAIWCLRNSPNLESFVVEHHLYHDDDYDDDQEVKHKVEHEDELVEVLDCSGISLDHLKKVASIGAGVTKPEMKLMRVLLANAPNLRKFVIKPGYGMTSNKEMTLLKEIARIPRASTVAEVEYVDRNFQL